MCLLAKMTVRAGGIYISDRLLANVPLSSVPSTAKQQTERKRPDKSYVYVEDSARFIDW